MTGGLCDAGRVRGLYRGAAAQELVQGWCRTRLAGWSVPHRTRTVPTPAGDTHLTTCGTAGPVVVHLPGTNLNAATSLRLAEALAPHCRVVLADLPGQPGLSASRRMRPADFAGWVDAVLAALPQSEEGPVLVGHSRGAAVALAAEPRKVSALVLVSPAGLVPARVSPAVMGTALGWMLRPSALRSERLATVMSGAAHRPDPTLVEWWHLVARSCRTGGAPGPLPPNVLGRWVGTPRRVLVGAEDCFFAPQRLRPVVRDRLGVEVDVLDGSGHLAVDEEPGAVVAAVRAALPDGAG